MTVLVQLRNAHKRFGDQVLLDNAEVTLTDEVKVGFVGRNGAGKSTLLRVLLNEEELDSGNVVFHPRLQIGYLRQHDPFLPGESALEFLMRDSGQSDWRCGEVAGQFELKGDYLEGPVSELSGGWQTRVKLTALLLHEPNLLLLDEPTNFLDLRTQILLEHFLRGFQRGCVIVSHDRAFLKATCSHTLSLSRGKLTMFSGPIDTFLENERVRREHDVRVNSSVKAKQKQLQRFIDKNRANANTASQARSKAKQLAKLKLEEIQSEEPAVFIRAPRVEPRHGTAVRCTGLQIGYDECPVATEITLDVDHGARAAIVGDNGQGKTTLLRTLVGSLPPLQGNVRWGHGCEIGTYAQHVYGSLPDTGTVYEYLEQKAQAGTTHQDILAQAGALLFRGDHVDKKIRVLSGGERARVCLAGLLLGEYNVLVLDEPGNHLDVESVEALVEALIAYRGTVLFTSHDRHFMHRLATSVIEVRDGSARNYGGDYDAYVYAVNREIDDGERQRLQQRTAGPMEKPKKSNRKQVLRDRRKIRKEISKVERAVSQLDQQKHELNESLLGTTDADEAIKLHATLEQVSLELEQAEQRWLELQEEAEE